MCCPAGAADQTKRRTGARCQGPRFPILFHAGENACTCQSLPLPLPLPSVCLAVWRVLTALLTSEHVTDSWPPCLSAWQERHVRRLCRTAPRSQRPPHHTVPCSQRPLTHVNVRGLTFTTRGSATHTSLQPSVQFLHSHTHTHTHPCASSSSRQLHTAREQRAVCCQRSVALRAPIDEQTLGPIWPR